MGGILPGGVGEFFLLCLKSNLELHELHLQGDSFQMGVPEMNEGSAGKDRRERGHGQLPSQTSVVERQPKVWTSSSLLGVG